MRVSKEEMTRAINARRTMSYEEYARTLAKPFVKDENEMFQFDLQLFGKGGDGKSVGKILISVVGACFGFFNPTVFGLASTACVAGAVMGAALGGTIWTTVYGLTHDGSGGLGDKDTPSISRFDRVQESMTSTASVPVVYGMRKMAGNQTFHETNADQNILHKHVVLCEGGIEGIQSVCANDLLIPTNGQKRNTVFTITNTLYEDARVWKDGQTFHLYCNGKDHAIHLVSAEEAKNPDSQDKIDTYYAWQTSIDALIAYINRRHEGWQAFPLATTTKYPGDLSCACAIVSQGTKTVTPEQLRNEFWTASGGNAWEKAFERAKETTFGRAKNQTCNVGQRIGSDNHYCIVKSVNMPEPKPTKVNAWGREWNYVPKVSQDTRPASYTIEVFSKNGGNACYNSLVDVTAPTVTGGTKYVFHDNIDGNQYPPNYNEVGGYPKMAWLDMTFRVSEELNGNPSVTCVVKGKKVYDPRTRRTAYSDNPALCVRDFLLSKRYGLGKWISPEDLDDDSFIEAANYCDEVITIYDADNNPIKSKRYTLNMIIDQRQDAIKWLQDMLANFAGWLVISRTKIKLLIEKPSPICYKFDDNNVKDMKIVPLKANDTPNHYVISLCSPEMNWKVIQVVVDDFADQKARGKVITKDVELSGVTSQSQALRLARYYSDYNLSCPITLTFTTGIEAMALECGDVISVSYRDAFKNMPIRISTIKETADNEFEISGRQYNPDIYSDDLGGGIQTKNYASTPAIEEDSAFYLIQPVEHLEAKTLARKNKDGHTEYDISITYMLPINHCIKSALVYYKTDSTDVDSNSKTFAEDIPADELGFEGSDWKFAGESVSQVTIPNVHIGDRYMIRVITKTEKGKLYDFENAPEVICTVTPKSTVPPKPYNLMYNFENEFRFIWQDVADSDVIYYEIRTDTNVGDSQGLLGRTTAPTASVKLTKRRGTVYVYAVNSHKKYSAPASTEYEYPKPLAPEEITFYKIPRGIRIACPTFPMSCKSMNLYITSDKVSDKFVSDNAIFDYMGEPSIYYVRVAYVDMLGEGYVSREESFVINPTFDPAWIEDGTVSEAKMDGAIKAVLEEARQATQDIVELKKTDESIVGKVSKLDDNLVSEVKQMAGQITSVVSDLNETDPEKFKYSALAQLNDGINARVAKGDVINQINMTAEGTTIDGKYLHITGTTKIDDTVIQGNMIDTGAIVADHIKAGAITSDKMNVKSLSAICATIGTLRSKSSGARVEIKDNLIQVFDGNNKLRVRLGVW